MTIALAGNPNSGKTTLFNAITGARRHVGNYAGVTVELGEGVCVRNGKRFRVVDMPGTYSLSATSPEEAVARDFLLREQPDVVVQVVDAANLERNLYLAVQVRELGARLVVALNMADRAKANGIEFDLRQLSHFLKAPVIPTIATRGDGVDALLAEAERVAGLPPPEPLRVSVPEEMTLAAADVAEQLPKVEPALSALYPTEWLAGRLVEEEPELCERLESESMRGRLAEWSKRIAARHGDDPSILAASARYGWISGVAEMTARRTVEARHDFSDRLDRVLLHRVLGLPIFLVLMYLVFQLVFTLGDPPMGWIEDGFGRLGGWLSRLWPRAADSDFRDLLVDGLIGGLGGVLVFLPNILLLFLAIAFLEGTGYMARAAFLMDRLMRKIGLHGKSFIPMLLGFGCTVPAIMGTRTLESRKDRLATILVLPFMSCGARLPIYALIIPVFFPERAALVLWLVYFIGIVFAILGAKLLRSTLLRGDTVPFVMELPPYRMPTFQSVVMLMWDRGKEYVKKAGTIILAACIVLWAMATFPRLGDEANGAFDARREAARAEYLERAATLGEGAAFAAADGRNVLGLWAEALSEWLAARADHWEDSPEVAEAEAVFAARVGELRVREPRLEMFATLFDGFEEIEGAFAEATVEAEEGSVEFLLAEKARADALAALATLDAGMFALVGQYRDEALAPWLERRTGIGDERMAAQMAHSVSGRIGKTLEPVIRPIGFDWRIGTALVGALAAKEVFVAQLGIVFSKGEADETSEGLREALRENYSGRTAFAIMLFCLLSCPCVATVAVCRRETQSWKWALGQALGLTFVAYGATWLFYQISGFWG